MRARYWSAWVSGVFLRAYLAEAASGPLLPPEPDELRVLFEVYSLSKALHDLGRGLEHRPDQIRGPLRGLLQLLEEPV